MRKFFSFSGKVNRKEFLSRGLMLSLVVFVYLAIYVTVGGWNSRPIFYLGVLLAVAVVVSVFSLSMRRLSDIGENPYLSLSLFVAPTIWTIQWAFSNPLGQMAVLFTSLVSYVFALYLVLAPSGERNKKHVGVNWKKSG